MKLKVDVAGSASETAWDLWEAGDTTIVGTPLPSLSDQQGGPTDISLEVITPFSSSGGNASLTNSSHHSWESPVWNRRAWRSDTTPAQWKLSGTDLVPGDSYTINIAGLGNTSGATILYTVNGESDVYQDLPGGTPSPVTPNAPAQITAVATDDGGGKGALNFSAEPDPSSSTPRNYTSGFTVQDGGGSSSVYIAATTLENADGSLDTGREVNRTVTKVADGTELFSGTQTSDASSAKLPVVNLTEENILAGDDVNDFIERKSPNNPGVVSAVLRRSVSGTGG